MNSFLFWNHERIESDIQGVTMNKRIKGTVSAMNESDIKGVTMNKEMKGTVSAMNESEF